MNTLRIQADIDTQDFFDPGCAEPRLEDAVNVVRQGVAQALSGVGRSRIQALADFDELLDPAFEAIGVRSRFGSCTTSA